MTSFKSGSGDLSFGNDGNDEEDTSAVENESEEASHASSEQSTPKLSQSSAQTDNSSSQSDSTTSPKYPYFVRRNNVGDERDNRLEIHVRDKVIDREAEFRRELAEQLGVGEISKTDIREFALLDAYHNPERIAKRMQEEGFGELD